MPGIQHSTLLITIEGAMMLDITLPAIPGGAAQVLRWLADPGAALGAGAPLLIVRSEVAEVALPAPEAGGLAEILAPVGATVEEGRPLARLRPAGRQDRPAPARITPLAHRIAQAHGIDPAALAGSGADGRVVAADVRHSVGPKHAPNAIAASAELSAAHASPLPVATAMVEFDAGPALARCAAQGAEFGRLGLRANLTACVAAATAGLLPRHRSLNARWTEGGTLLRRRVHLAVAARDGERLTWALVRDAGDLTMRGVARALRAVSDPALGEATFGLVILADGDLWQSAPPPLAGTVAALGLGAPRRRAVACGDAVAVRPIATLSLSYDARALDHAHAAAFLRDLREDLERM
ncbi:2-oxo acid dehydrogenase subunit E2 [Oscillochloris sp. ZM17-4]|uniref:2-oxo acid dehydrogenase subunit E2 n=1 Tax=Oscillochloris sp. ZM17-4 TaxID=2866714 RepID=UPI001C734DC4|nr:2-oxo acid dehydrogenase subunit E2 [Oscillochloris sp. ZM17-4]MBX0327596.1 2-oxo acid dehydrogenase subunit E2 [Oscillochloris sp. ZM17-4]